MRSRTVIFAASILAATSAAAEDFTARAILSYQDFNTGIFTTSGFRQTYDLRLERALTDPARFMIFFRGEDFRGSTETIALPARTGFRQLQPGGEFSYQLPKLQALLRYNTLQATSETGSLANKRNLDRTSGFLSWMPDGLPSITLDGQRNRSADQTTGLNTTDQLGVATIGYQFRQLHVGGGERISRLSDNQFGFGRESHDHFAEMTYDDRFFRGRVSTYATGTATVSKLTERAGTAMARIPNPVVIQVASYAIDDTPLDNTDHPLTPLPALIDNNIGVSTGISLSPDSVSYHNIAFDFGRFADVDEIQVIVRDGAGNPVKLGGSVRFDAFVSEDGVKWTPLTGGARTQFDVARSLYDVTFQLKTTRWLKLVSFSVNDEATFVTETRAFYHTELAANQKRTTDIRVFSGTGTISAQPLRWLQLSYNGLFNTADQNPSDRDPFSTRDMDHIGTVQFDPNRYLSFGARYQLRTVNQTGGTQQTLDGWNSRFKFMPTRALDLTLEADRTNEDNQGRLTETNTLVLHTFARVLPSVDFNVDIGRQRQDYATERLQTDERFITGVGNVQVTRALRILLTGSLQRTEFIGTGNVIEGLPPARDDRSTLELYYRPGQPFAAGARFGWVTSDSVSGVTQRYRLEWYPFAQGTLSIGGTYDEDVDPYLNRRSTRFIFTPRWTMNRHAILDLNYTTTRSSSDDVIQALRTRSFYATLTLTK